MTDRLKSLRIESFRGATQPLNLEFDERKRLLLIFGENGTGKSSIVDALECVGSGTTAFLDDWKLGSGKRKEPYIPALGKALKDVKIALQFGSQTYSASLARKGLQLCTTPARPQTKVLRRKSLQAFIDADPSQRYKEVSSFLDIPQVEAAEASLRSAHKRAKGEFDSASSANAQALESLQGLWESEGSLSVGNNHTDAETWARAQSKAKLNLLEQDLAALRSGLKLIESLTAAMQNRAKASEEEKQAKITKQQADEKLASLEADSVKSNAQLVILLQDAKTYLSATPDTLCPVCEETQINSNELVQRLDQRITGMGSLKSANDAKQQALSSLKEKSAILKKAEEAMLDAGAAARKHFSNDAKELFLTRENASTTLKASAESAIALHNELAKQQGDLQTRIDGIQKQCNTLSVIKQHVATLDEKASEAKRAEVLQKKLGQAVAIVESKRKTYVETVLTEIAQAVDDLYQTIHPLENIGQLKLKLDVRQRGSLVYGVAFGEQQDIQPQPYYSESHLDTLGLCIFLALAKRSDPSKTVIVLDDVLGSVDQQHLKRTLDMLFAETDSFAQIVITTHYRPLRDQFRYARAPSIPVQLLELKPWNFEQGIRSGKSLSYVQELRQQLQEDTFRRDVIASQAGQLFESLLEFVSCTYRCKVPHTTEPRFTFGELASAPNKELKKSLKILLQAQDDATVETQLAPIYSKLDEAISVRNLVGCHFNQWAGELADQDVRDMAALALEFADTIICAHCGGLPTSSSSGSYWQCSCKKMQMHPLKQPKK